MKSAVHRGVTLGPRVSTIPPCPTRCPVPGPCRFPARSVPRALFAEEKGAAVKVKASVKRMCNFCQIVRRKGKVRVICKNDPKHKQVQG